MISFSICVVKDDKTAFLLHPTLLEYFADPFVLGRQGDWIYVLAERYARLDKKGAIVVVAINFATRQYKVSTLISEAFHLSYPCVIRRNGELYVTPESEADSRQHFYHVGWLDAGFRAKRVASIPGRYVDLTVRSLGGDDFVARFYNGTSNSNGMLIEMKFCFDGRVVTITDNVLAVKGTSRPAGSVEGECQPYQRPNVGYGAGVDMLDREGWVVERPGSGLPKLFLDTQDRSHHVHQHENLVAFDVRMPVMLRPRRQAFFATPAQIGAYIKSDRC